MVLRIKTTDFSEFAGMRYTHPKNKELDEYINIFKTNDNLTTFQIEDKCGTMELDLICYCQEKLKNCGMFTKVEYNDDGKILGYWLCFYKK